MDDLVYINLQSNKQNMNINNQEQAPTLTQKFHHSQNKLAASNVRDREKNTNGSRVERFQYQAGDTPGPGAYDSTIKEKHTYDFHVVKDQSLKSPVSKQHQWIMGSGRLGFVMSNYSGIKLGPGQYYQHQSNSNSSVHSGWAKGQRFQTKKGTVPQIGPGSYQKDETKQQKVQRVKPLAVFQSKCPKTFFQEMVLKHQRSTKRIASNPQDQMSNDDQSQTLSKLDQTSYPTKRKTERLSSMFRSKCERPEISNQHLPANIGPGYYQADISDTKTDRMKGLTSAIHYSLNPLKNANRSITLSSKITPPGPGAYQLDSISKSEAVTKKSPLGVMYKEERFKLNSNNKDLKPGPGQYMRNRYTIIKQEDIRLKNKGSFARKAQKVHDFGTAARTSLRKHDNNPFGEYNVNNYDLQYKLMKQKEHIDKLKLMEVTLPAFNTKKHG